MWVVHLINRINPKTGSPVNLKIIDDVDLICLSGFWDFDLKEAKKLIGGKIYLHESKAKPSHTGGKVLDVSQEDLESHPDFYVQPTENTPVKKNRVVFKFISTMEGRGKNWGVKSEPRVWTSGIIQIP